MDTLSFLTNSNVLTVVDAYLDALDATDFDAQVALVQKVIRNLRDYGLKMVVISAKTDIPVARLYEYNRKDWVERHRRTMSSAVGCNVMIRDIVHLLALADGLAR